jgi:purine nucleoside phosphorylase
LRSDACEKWGADIAIILGPDLIALAQEAPVGSAISYSEFNELPKMSEPGHAGRAVAGFSCLTNWAAGVGSGSRRDQEVLGTSQAAASIFSRLLDTCLAPSQAA